MANGRFGGIGTNPAKKPRVQTNQLYYGDNLDVLREKIDDESVDLVYIDPPFSSARNYFVIFKDRTGDASAAQTEAFTDTWDWGPEAAAAFNEIVMPKGPAQMGRHNLALAATIRALREMLHESPMMAYLVAMSVRIIELHRVLKSTGSFYLHCDPTASHYLKILLDTVFGPKNFRDHITWQRSDSHNDAKHQFPAISDHILFYSKSDKYTFNKQHAPHADKTLADWYQYLEFSDGTTRRMTKQERESQKIPAGSRRFNADNMTSPNPRPNLMYEYKGYPFPAKGWRYSREKMEELDKANKLLFPKDQSGRIMLKRYLDEQAGVVVGDVWNDISQLRGTDSERLGYPTQKPLSLLRRVIDASSNPGDIVLDAFCGCGTTVHAAHELGRQWIGIDITPVAVGVIKTRMEQAFSGEGLKVPIDGLPRDMEGARTLFETDPHKFQIWACTEIGAFPLTKKGKDNGIDGWLPFADFDESHHKAVVQVKGGKLTLSSVRDFCHVVTREKATLGFFLCLEEPTKAMNLEALKMGVWESAGGAEYARVQLLTIGDLIAGKIAARYPRQEKKSALGFKAGKTQKTTDKNLAMDI